MFFVIHVNTGSTVAPTTTCSSVSDRFLRIFSLVVAWATTRQPVQNPVLSASGTVVISPYLEG